MHSTLFIVASLALLVVCACAPSGEDVIQHIPAKAEPTPSLTGKDGSASSAAAGNAGASKPEPARVRRDAGQESDLLPSANEVDVSPFGETSQLEGRGRIRVLPAYLG